MVFKFIAAVINAASAVTKESLKKSKLELSFVTFK